MVQLLVISMIRIITSTFFRRIDVVGLENVPADGAIIFAGNHPNALMDGWLLTAKCGRWPLHFVYREIDIVRQFARGYVIQLIVGASACAPTRRPGIGIAGEWALCCRLGGARPF